MNTVLQHRGGPGEGDLLIACGTIVQSYMLLIATPMSSITLGCQGVVSFNLGGRPGAGEQALRGVLLLCLGFGALMLAVTQLFSPQFAGLFSEDGEVLARSVSYIKLYTAAALCMAVQWTVVDMSTALGQVELALFCSLICQRRFEIVRKRRRNFVVFRLGGNKNQVLPCSKRVLTICCFWRINSLRSFRR